MWILNTAVAFFHIYWTCASVEYTSDISNVKPVKKKIRVQVLESSKC